MTLPRERLLTIFNSFVRPLLKYADFIYDKPCNDTLKGKLEAVQYNACLAINGAIRGTFWERLYRELGLETLIDHRRSRKLFCFHKIIKGIFPSYLRKNFCFCNVQHYQARPKSTKIKEKIKGRE